MYKLLLLLLIPLCISACRTSKAPAAIAFKSLENPPGTVKIADNLYFDETEMTNQGYLEFMFWTQRAYGLYSEEYQRILPDTGQWLTLNGNYDEFASYYLKHPAYLYFPLVGISYEQAILYSTWRSDRVMEHFLIKNRLIPYVHSVSKDSVFTIEKYFTGQFNGIKPNPDVLYPEYTLPDPETYYKAAIFADSLNTVNLKPDKEDASGYNFYTENYCLNVIEHRTDQKPYGPDATLSTLFRSKKPLITHLKGNVRETTAIKGLFYGNSFKDSCHVATNVCRTDSNMANAYTGFRNVCRYKRWE